MRKRYTGEERKEARAVSRRAWRRKEREANNIPTFVHDEREVVPVYIIEAQRRRILFVQRAIERGTVTANQFLLGDPVKSGSVTSSLSKTEIYALLG